MDRALVFAELFRSRSAEVYSVRCFGSSAFVETHCVLASKTHLNLHVSWKALLSV